MHTSAHTRTRRTRTAAVAGALVAAALALTACSGSSGTADASASASASSHNDADVTFAQGMVPHHQQAVEMAQLVPDRSTDPQVLDLARRIEAAQGPEIDTLQGWLSDWGTAGEGTDHSGMAMGGMMSDQDMADLQAATGTAFGRLWLQLMLEHHTGAVGMAQTEIADGQDPDAVAMAQDIVASQSAEITEMEGLLQAMSTR